MLRRQRRENEVIRRVWWEAVRGKAKRRWRAAGDNLRLRSWGMKVMSSSTTAAASSVVCAVWGVCCDKAVELKVSTELKCDISTGCCWLYGDVSANEDRLQSLSWCNVPQVCSGFKHKPDGINPSHGLHTRAVQTHSIIYIYIKYMSAPVVSAGRLSSVNPEHTELQQSRKMQKGFSESQTHYTDGWLSQCPGTHNSSCFIDTVLYCFLIMIMIIRLSPADTIKHSFISSVICLLNLRRKRQLFTTGWMY